MRKPLRPLYSEQHNQSCIERVCPTLCAEWRAGVGPGGPGGTGREEGAVRKGG